MPQNTPRYCQPVRKDLHAQQTAKCCHSLPLLGRAFLKSFVTVARTLQNWMPKRHGNLQHRGFAPEQLESVSTNCLQACASRVPDRKKKRPAFGMTPPDDSSCCLIQQREGRALQEPALPESLYSDSIVLRKRRGL